MSDAGTTSFAQLKRDYRRSLLWSMVFTILIFGIADANLVFVILALLTLMGAWSFSVRPGRPLSRLAINTALAVILAIAAAVTLRAGVNISSFAIFAAMLLIVKVCDLHSPRDDGQVIVLLLSLVVAAILTSNSMITGVLLLVTGVMLLRAVVRFHIYAAAFQAGQRAIIGQLAGRGYIDLRSYQSVILLFAVVIGTLVFLILPRNLGTSAFGSWGNASTGSVTGFTDEVELGRPGLISQSSTPVLDLEVYDRDLKSVGAIESQPIYLRGAVLNKYDNGRWLRVEEEGRSGMIRIQTIPPNVLIHPTRHPTRQGWDHEYRISLRSTNLRESTIFLPWMPVEFRSPGSPVRIGYDKATGWMFHDGISSAIKYRVRTMNAVFLDVHPPDDYIRPKVDPDGITEVISEHAATIVRNAGLDPDPLTRPVDDDLAVVRVLENYLQTKYTYSLVSQPVPPGRDATEWFLMDHREGHCEYYASSLALMARSTGIDTRVITGYVATDFNQITGQYVVRESNAHAWVEANVSYMKWMTFDGTPRADFQQIHEPTPGFFRSIARWYETVEYAWVKGVLGYDSQSRKNIFGDISPDLGLMRFGYMMRDRFDNGRTGLIGKAVLVAVIVFAATFVLGLVLIRNRSILLFILEPLQAFVARQLARFSGNGSTPAELSASRLESAISRSLTAAKIEREKWMPLQTALDGQDPLQRTPLHGALNNAAALLYRIRFGPSVSPPDPGEVSAVIRRLRASEKQPAQSEA